MVTLKDKESSENDCLEKLSEQITKQSGKNSGKKEMKLYQLLGTQKKTVYR